MPETHYFTSYSGVKLPLRLIGAIAPDALANRNTFIRAHYDETGRLSQFEKIVYGAVELSHHYTYREDGSLARAEIIIPDEDIVLMDFAEMGAA